MRGLRTANGSLRDAPEIYYVTDYYRSYPLVLVRLSPVEPDDDGRRIERASRPKAKNQLGWSVVLNLGKRSVDSQWSYRRTTAGTITSIRRFSDTTCSAEPERESFPVEFDQ